VHLFGFEGDLYGDLLHVELIAWLRGEMAFADVESLKGQMVLDCAEAERLLAQML
jgi:riboflavin kinase/FMN adenylyltransferase